MTTTTRIEHHPDLVAMRAQYERAASTPVAQAVESLSFLTALYLAVSPWIVGFNGSTTITANNLITGLALAVLSLGFGSIYERTRGMSMAAAAIGAWTIIAPFVVAGDVDTRRIVLSNVIVGGVAVLLALATAAVGKMRR